MYVCKQICVTFHLMAVDSDEIKPGLLRKIMIANSKIF